MYKKIFSFAMISYFIVSCSNNKCSNNSFLNQRFQNIDSGLTRFSFLITKTTTSDFVDNKLRSVSKIRWMTCDSYVIDARSDRSQSPFDPKYVMVVYSMALLNDTLYFKSFYNGKHDSFKAIKVE
jgi:hypothetical protein